MLDHNAVLAYAIKKVVCGDNFMPDDDNQFVQIPTMTIRKPKKKAMPGKALIPGIVIMGAAIVILAVAFFVLS